MTLIASIKANEEHICVAGDITLANVMTVYQASLPLVAMKQCYAFDFLDVRSSDSAGLALMIEWMRLAKANGKKASFHHVPPKLMSIAKAASLDSLFA